MTPNSKPCRPLHYSQCYISKHYPFLSSLLFIGNYKSHKSCWNKTVYQSARTVTGQPLGTQRTASQRRQIAERSTDKAKMLRTAIKTGLFMTLVPFEKLNCSSWGTFRLSARTASDRPLHNLEHDIDDDNHGWTQCDND